MFHRILTAFLSVICCVSLVNADDRPNILFISVDDLRPELNCYGASHIKSPNIDALAAKGVRFNAAYCQQAVCLPSRISLFTGMRPDSTGIHDLFTHFRDTIPDAVTITQHLRKNGYQTIGMGKVYHDEQWKEWDQWIDIKKTEGITEYHLDEIAADLARRESEAKRKDLKGNVRRQYVKGPSLEAADAPDSKFHDGAMTDVAIDLLKSSGDQPFFMTVGYRKPHLPFVAPKKYWDMYDRDVIDLPDNYNLPKNAPQVALSTWGELRAYNDIPKEGPVTNEKARELIHGYYACISFVDTQIGRLLSALEQSGLDQKTVVILWSDHGWKLGEHAMWCKHTNFEIDARVPMIIRLPKQNEGRVDEHFVELVDLYPTVCELAGIETPTACEGSSLMPILSDESSIEWRKESLSQYKRARKKGGDIIGYSMKFAQGRYTEWINQKTDKRQAVEFYDHREDPDENRNANAELSKAQSQALTKRLRERIGGN